MFGISTVSTFELPYPLWQRRLDEQKRIAKSYIHELKTLPLDSLAAEESVDTMWLLLRTGRPVNVLIALNADTAVANGGE